MPKQQEEQRGFRYQKRSREDLKERANMKGGNYDSYIKPRFKQWKPKDGKNIIRILPPTWKDARHYGMDIFVNFNVGPDNQSYLSLSKHGKGADPLEEARREAQREGDKDFAKKLNPSQRILYWIIDRNDEDEGPLLWAAPFTFDKSLSNLCIDEETKDVMFIDDPQEGCDVRFYKEGQGLLTKYDPSKMKLLKSSTIHEDEGQENDWLDFIHENPLPDVLNFYDYDHIKMTFDGQIGSRDDDDDEKPAARKRPSNRDDDAAPQRRTQRGGGEDDAEDRPAPRSGRQRIQRDADDDAADQPRGRRNARDTEADDEPAPSRRSTRKPDPEEDNETPRSRSRSRVDEDEERPARGRVSSRQQEEPEDDEASEEEAEDEDPPSTRRTSKSKDEGRGGNLRERLAARRSKSRDDD
jgi:hypothetical protein